MLLSCIIIQFSCCYHHAIIIHYHTIIMLKHEVMAVDERHNNGPQELVTVSLRIQIAIDKMQLCSLSVVYDCLYRNPTTVTMGRSADVNVVNKLPGKHEPGIHP